MDTEHQDYRERMADHAAAEQAHNCLTRPQARPAFRPEHEEPDPPPFVPDPLTRLYEKRAQMQGRREYWEKLPHEKIFLGCLMCGEILHYCLGYLDALSFAIRVIEESGGVPAKEKEHSF